MTERLKVGDVLWYVPSTHYNRTAQGQSVTVTKVGRKWATLDGTWHDLRVDMDDGWRADGGEYRSPGRAYRSREAYEARVALSAAWEPFRRRVGATMTPPDSVDLEWISAAAERLGMTP